MAITFLSDGAAGTGVTPVSTAFATVFDGTRSGTVTVDTAVKEHGYAALKHDSVASVSAYIARNACLADAGRRISVRMRFDNPSDAAGGSAILRLLTAADANVAEIRLDAAGKLRLYGGASATTLLATGATTIDTSGTTWYRIAFCYTITSASVSEFRVYLDGALELTASNPASQGTGTSRLRLGWTGTTPGANKVMRSQDVYVDDSTALTDPGNVRVTGKMPAGTGTNNAFDTAVGTGTNRWDRVAERPANTANRYTQAGTSQQIEAFTVQTAATGDDDLTGATILGWGGWAHYSVAAAAGSVLASIVVNGTASTLTSVAASGAYQTGYATAGVTTYPAASGNIVGLRSSGSAVDTHLAEAGVFIAYTIQPPAVLAAGTATAAGAADGDLLPHPISGTGIGHWQWYTDATPDGSMAALASADVVPTLSGAQTMGGTLRLRTQLRDTGTIAALHLEYSVDGTNWSDIPNADQSGVSNAENRWLRWANGAATAGGTIGSQLLSGTTSSGTYHESRGAAETVGAGAIREIDLALNVIWPPPATTVRIRLLDGASPIALATGATEIQFTTCAVADRLYTIDKASANASGGQNREINHASWPRLHYDGSNWWFFAVDPGAATSLSYWKAPSNLGSGWTKSTVGMTVNGATTSETDVKHGVAFAVISATHVVGALVAPSSGTMHYRRGYFIGGAITWAADTDLGQARYNAHSHLAIDDGGYHWIGGIDGTSGVWACRSTAADDGSSGYVPSFGTISSRRKTVADTVAAGARFALVPLASDKVLALWNNASDLKAAVCTDAGGFGAVVQVNTTADAHPDDWGVTRMGGNVYVVHSDGLATGGTLRTRVYSIGGNSWAAGTDPGAAAHTQNSNADGVVLTNDGATVSLFATGIGTEGGQDRTIWANSYSGGTGGTWTDKGVITPAGGRGNGDDIAGPDVAANGVVPVAYLFNDDDVNGKPFTYEVHVLSLGAPASLTATAATAAAAGEAVTFDAASTLTVAAAPAPAAGLAVALTGQARIVVTGATAPAAAGSVVLRAAATLTGASATAPAAAGAVDLHGPGAVAGTLTVTAATAPAAGGTVALSGMGRLVGSVATAPAAGGTVAFGAASTLTIAASTASAAAGAVVLGAGAAGVLTVAPATAPATAAAVAFAAAARLSVTPASASAQGEGVTFDAAARLVLAAATASAAGGAVTLLSVVVGTEARFAVGGLLSRPALVAGVLTARPSAARGGLVVRPSVLAGGLLERAPTLVGVLTERPPHVAGGLIARPPAVAGTLEER